MARGRRPNKALVKSGRKKRKSNGRGGHQRVTKGSPEKFDIYTSDPRSMYVNANPQISLPVLAKMYSGRRGWSLLYLKQRCAKEGWVKRRKEKQKRVDARTLDRVVEKEGVTKADQIERANIEHVKFGRDCREAAAKLLKDATDKDADKLKSKEALRIVAQLGAKGVDIERKGLGLADKFVHVRVIRESTYKYIEVLRAHLSAQPDLMEVVIAECESILLKVEQEAAEHLNIDEFE